MSRTAIVIPARYASTRYPGKPLALLSGRTLLERSIAAARAAAEALPGGASVAVATDDDRIAAEATRCGAAVVMTDSACENGTARVAQAVLRADLDAEVIVNLQGDAPLTPPGFVLALVAAMRADPGCAVATPVLRCDAEALANFRADRRAGRVGATTVVRALDGRALYFSKEVIPYSDALGEGELPVFHHVGLYAYRPEALALYGRLPQGPLERIEGLEQLRFLENGHPVACVEVEAPATPTGERAAFWELNNPSDVPLIEGYLARMGTA